MIIDTTLKGLDTLRDKLLTIKQKQESSNVIPIRKKYKTSNESKGDPNNKKNKKQRFRITPTSAMGVIALSIFVIFIIWAVVHKNSYEIYIGDIPVGIIKEKELEKDIYNTAVAQIETTEGAKIKLDSNYEVTSKFVRSSKKDLATTDYVISEVRKKMTYTVNASVISVAGVEMGIVKNEETIQSTLKKILDEYKLENAEEVDKGFIEEYNISYKFVNKNEIISADELHNKLTAQTETIKTYEVKSGDTLWAIANSNGLTLTQMLKINPNITEKTILKIGQQLNLVVPKPVLSVKVVSQIKYTETIPYSVEYQTDDSQYKTFKKTSQEGRNGTKEVTAHVTYINGYKEDTEIVGEPVVTLEPVPAIIVTGTKSLPAKSATGSFIRPISGGSISSYFGSRWGSFHNALDIAAPKGTTIYSSDGGTVIFAGWQTSFGNIVIIDHDNGFQTYYAHCSRLDVKAGQKVAKGEKIAAVGSTGNSTGNHVHFEIRKNDTPVNPLNYIK